MSLTKIAIQLQYFASVALRLRSRSQLTQVLELESCKNPELLLEPQLLVCFFVDWIVPFFLEAVQNDARASAVHSADETLEASELEQIIMCDCYSIQHRRWRKLLLFGRFVW